MENKLNAKQTADTISSLRTPCWCGIVDYQDAGDWQWLEQRGFFLKCKECGQTRTYPIPDFDYKQGMSVYKPRINSPEPFNLASKNILDVLSAHHRPGRLLDVGCSVGILVNLARETGWDAYGIDPDEVAIQIGQANGIQILEATDIQSFQPDELFDAITLSHVLEHVLNPLEFLDQCKRLLKEDGILYIEVPNWDSIMRKQLGKNWYLLVPDQHVWQFEPTSLVYLLERAGYRNIQVKTVGATWNISLREVCGWLSNRLLWAAQRKNEHSYNTIFRQFVFRIHMKTLLFISRILQSQDLNVGVFSKSN